MPRIRTFKPEFFRSPDTAKASHAARILYVAMWSWADDFGIGETNLYGLLGFAFPDEDQLTPEDLQRLLKEIRGSYGAVFYENRGRYFYAVPAWDDHQKTERRANRRNPGPDHPDSRPDLRFGTSEETQGNSATTQGNSPVGTGEHRNIGTGVVGATEVSHQSPSSVAPPRKCSRHITDLNPPDCGGCASARREHDAWKAAQEKTALDELEAKRQQREDEKTARLACTLCDENGMRETPTGLTRCAHQEAVHA